MLYTMNGLMSTTAGLISIPSSWPAEPSASGFTAIKCRS